MTKYPSLILLLLSALAAVHGARNSVVRVETLKGPSQSTTLFSAEDSVAAYKESLRSLTEAASMSLSLSMYYGGDQTTLGAGGGGTADGTPGTDTGTAAAGQAESSVDQSSAAKPPNQAVLVGVLVATVASVVGAFAAVQSRKPPAAGLVKEVPEEDIAESSSTEQLVPEGTADSQDAEV